MHFLKGHKCVMMAETAVWLHNCLCLYSYLYNKLSRQLNRNTRFLGLHIPTGISIGSSVFAELTVVTNRQTTLHHPFNSLFSRTGVSR